MPAAEARRCPRCDTPHHPDCWRYAGGCAIFGCAPGGQRLPAAPGAGAALQGASDDWLRCFRRQWWCLMGAAGSLFAAYGTYTFDLVAFISCASLLLACLAAYVGLAVQHALLHRRLVRLLPGGLVAHGRAPARLRAMDWPTPLEARVSRVILLVLRAFGAGLAVAGSYLVFTGAQLPVEVPPGYWLLLIALGAGMAAFAPRALEERLAWVESVHHRLNASLKGSGKP